MIRQLFVLRLLCLGLVLWSAPSGAVEPDEILADPALETRAREISKELRCLVCRNESIDDSNAGLARDLRVLVRERLVAGDTDEGVKTYLVDRYGEFVLLKPTFTLANAALWFAGPVVFLLGLLASVLYVRSRRPVVPETLSAEEQAELERILKR
ncbi:MAG: cytochrome c-type biogenesis protein [Pseudomonadota bacterium]